MSIEESKETLNFEESDTETQRDPLDCDDIDFDMVVKVWQELQLHTSKTLKIIIIFLGRRLDNTSTWKKPRSSTVLKKVSVFRFRCL